MKIGTFMILALFFVLVIPISSGESIFRYDPKDKRDPFTPLVDREGNLLPEYRPTTAAVTLNLEGIVWSGKGESYTIISGAVLRAGEMIGDYTVKKIERSGVILTRGGDIMTINLSGEEE